MIKHRLKFYKNAKGQIPVLDYLEALSARQIVKIRNALRILMEFGTNEPFLNIKKIKGDRHKGLYELKINQSRIFYFINKFGEYILLHGFTKKTTKTPVNELEVARNRMKEFK